MTRRAAAREMSAWADLANIIALRPSDRLGRVAASSASVSRPAAPATSVSHRFATARQHSSQ